MSTRRAGVVVALVAAACYLNAIPNDYAYDSVQIVRDSSVVNEPDRWADVWTVDHWHTGEGKVANRDLLYRPVALLTYRLVRAMAGPSAWPQHLVNVALHALISGLIVLLTRRIGASQPAAVIAGLAFAVLPIHTEVVDDIVGRTDLVATLGIIGALLIHRKMLGREPATDSSPLPAPLMQEGKRGVNWPIAGMVACFCALGAKESGLAVLPLLVIFDWYWTRGRTDGGIRTAAQAEACGSGKNGSTGGFGRAVSRLAYIAAPTAAYFALRYNALDGTLHQSPAVSKTINVLVDAPAWQHALGVIQLWGMYWAKTFAPLTLSPDYSVNTVRLATGALDGHVLLGLAVGVGLVAGSVVAWRAGNRLVAVLCLALVLCHLPTANAVVLIQVFFAERLWYLPSLFVCILLGLALAPLFRRRAVIAVFGLAVVAMGIRCWVRNPEWQDTSTVAAAAHRDHPDAIATLVVHGSSLARQGRHEEAIRLLTRAVEIDLGFTVAHRALGKVYAEAGDYERALHHLRIAEMQFPGHRDTQIALAVLNAKLGARAQDELAALEAAAGADPTDLASELAFLEKLTALGSYDRALRRLRKREQHFSNEAAWHKQYAVTLLYAGMSDDAIERYRRTVALNPSDTASQVELAALFMERRRDGDLSEADRLLIEAEAGAPGEPGVLVLRGELLAIQGDVTGAIALYRRVLDSIPPDHPQRGVWQTRARILGERP